MSGDQKRVAVLFGGRSVEHEISIITALQLIEAVDSARYSVIPVYVTLEGQWCVGKRLLDLEFYRGLPGSLEGVERVALLPIPGVGGLSVVDRRGSWRRSRKGQIIPIDVYFPAFHGTYGEDGAFQGLLELADVPYTGSGVLASAVAMDKFLAKKVAQAYDIPVLPGLLIKRRELQGGLAAVRQRIRDELAFPLFIKPCSLGSSVGISRASDDRQLDAALIEVFEVDEYAVVEPCIANPLEINVSIVGGETVRASVVEVPVVDAGATLGYEEKYMRAGGAKGSSLAGGTAGTARVIDPVDLPDHLKETVTREALKLFRALRCSGVVRADFICDASSGQIYFNELNTLPGSLAYYLWAESQPPILYTDLLTLLIEQAEISKERQRELRRSYGFRSLFRQR